MRASRAIIAGYNESLGGINDDTEGYHDTITCAFIAGIRLHLCGRPPAEPLVDAVNSPLASPIGRRDWPLGFYSRPLLFSVTARRKFVSPDLAPLPAMW